MTDPQDQPTIEEMVRQQNLIKSGWKAVTGKGAEWQQAVLKQELSMQDAITLAIGQMQGASYVLRMFLQHAQPKEVALDIAQEVASAVRDDLLQAVTKGHNDEEQRNQDGNTTENNQEEVS